MSNQSQLGLFYSGDAAKTSPSETSVKISPKVALNIDFSSPPEQHLWSMALDALLDTLKKLDPQMAHKVDYVGREKPWASLPFFSLDVETTGLDPAGSRVIELAMVPFNMSAEETGIEQLFFVDQPLSKEIIALTGITDDMLQGQPDFKTRTADIVARFKKASFVVAYNAKFDRPFLESEFARAGLTLPEIPWIDPFVFICELDRFKKGKKLTDSAKRWGVRLENAHRAKGDAMAAGQLMLKMAENIDCYTFTELLERQKLLQWQQAHSMAEYKKANSWAVSR